MTKFGAALLAALFLFAGLPQSTRAQDSAQTVTLSAVRGTLVVHGQLIGFDGLIYRVLTDAGEVSVDSRMVRCAGAGCPDLATFVPRLTLAIEPDMSRVLFPALIEAYARWQGWQTRRDDIDLHEFTITLSDPDSGNTMFEIALHVVSATEGFGNLLADEADGLVSRAELTDDDLKLARRAGLGNLSKPASQRILALDALVPVAAPRGDSRGIRMSDLAGVVSGKIGNWTRLNGPAQDITLHLPGPGGDLRAILGREVLAPFNVTEGEQARDYAVQQTLLDTVALDPSGLGFAAFTDLGNTTALRFTEDCGASMAASEISLKTGDYPLTTPVFLYLPARRLNEAARQFTSFLQSDAAQLVIARAGFVALRPDYIPLAHQGDRLGLAITQAGPNVSLFDLKNIVRRMVQSQRLSLTFRFRDQNLQLTPQSRAAMQSLIIAIEAGDLDARQVLLAGFSDGTTPPEELLSMSVALATRLKADLVADTDPAALAKVNLTAEGFGAALPIGCDDTAWGRQINRRVEVWVR